jgi:hypothetical protein
MITRAKAMAIVQEYTGRAPLKVEAVPDPKVPDCTALRATFAGDGSVDLILHQRTAGYDVEEVEFKSWPPRSI